MFIIAIPSGSSLDLILVLDSNTVDVLIIHDIQSDPLTEVVLS